MRKKSTKIYFFLLGFILFVMLLICSPRSALASIDQLGNEGDVLISNLPYDFIIHIPIIQTRLISIRQNYLTIWPSDIISILDTIDLRLSFIAQNPLPNPLISQETATQAIGILDRITSVLFNPQPEPPALPPDMMVHLVTVMDRISAILINPQPEPPAPALIAQGFNVLDRVSWILINPQPEPPAFNALDHLSINLLNAVLKKSYREVSAQINAMDYITQLYLVP